MCKIVFTFNNEYPVYPYIRVEHGLRPIECYRGKSK